MSAIKVEIRPSGPLAALTEVRVDGKVAFETMIHPHIIEQYLKKYNELMQIENVEVVIKLSK